MSRMSEDSELLLPVLGSAGSGDQAFRGEGWPEGRGGQGNLLGTRPAPLLGPHTGQLSPTSSWRSGLQHSWGLCCEQGGWPAVLSSPLQCASPLYSSCQCHCLVPSSMPGPAGPQDWTMGFQEWGQALVLASGLGEAWPLCPALSTGTGVLVGDGAGQPQSGHLPKMKASASHLLPQKEN